jgi:DNA ligase (NAD+)
MDIRNLGSETVEAFLRNGLISDIADLYDLDFEQIRGLEGFGDKKAELIQDGIEKSKEQPFHVVLPSLGLPELGPKAAEILIDAGFDSIEKLFEAADKNDREILEAVHGIGGITAETIIRELNNPRLRDQVKKLKQAGLQFSETAQEQKKANGIFSGQIWCVTGSFEHFKPRSKAMEEVKRRGGTTSGDVSGKTTHLLAGTGAGSKLEKARARNTVIVSEEEFLELLSED